MGEKIFYLIFGAAGTIMLVFFLLNNQTGLFLLEKNSEDFSDNDFWGTNFLLEPRNSYGVYSGVFADLPEPPKDFNRIVSL